MIQVSVVIPVYNASRTIGRCVESILGGHFKNVEIILIDDCSTDDSLNQCRILAQKYKSIRLFRNDKNHGVSYTRNRGIREAEGKYLLFVDSDDWVDENYLEIFSSVSEGTTKTNDPLLTVCGYINHDEKQSGRTEVFAWDGFEGEKKIRIEGIQELYENRLLQQLWNKRFLTGKVKENQLFFDENISIGEDFRFVLEYIKKCDVREICLINKPVYHYMRDQKGSLMYRVGYEGIEEPLKNLKMMYEILGMAPEEISEHLKSEKQRQLEIYAYLIFHNYGMKILEKKRLILKLDHDQGKILYKKNKILFWKEKIWLLIKRFTKIARIKHVGKED